MDSIISRSLMIYFTNQLSTSYGDNPYIIFREGTE